MDATMEILLRDIIAMLATYGIDVVAAVAILIIGWWFAGWTKRTIRSRLSKKARLDQTLISFLASFVKYLIVIFTVIAVLHQFGVQTASLITVLGAAGLAIGLALQGTLSNVAAGVMLLIFRPFRVGEFVEVQGGIAGTVKDISLFMCEFHTPDNVQIIVPNAQIWGNAIRNFSFNPTRRMELNVGIAYKEDLDKAFRVIREIIAAEPRALTDPEPMVVLMGLGDSSQDLVVRVWAKGADFWPTRFALLKAIKQGLDRERIEIPFPQRVVYMQQMGEAAQ